MLESITYSDHIGILELEMREESFS